MMSAVFGSVHQLRLRNRHNVEVDILDYGSQAVFENSDPTSDRGRKMWPDNKSSNTECAHPLATFAN